MKLRPSRNIFAVIRQIFRVYSFSVENTLIQFAHACKEAREDSGLKGEGLRLACERLVEERGELFRVLPSDISRYEKGAYLPSLQKFIGLLWLFGKPAGHYLKSLGIEPEQICSHNLSPEEQELVDFIQKDSGRSELHRRLRQIIEQGTEAEKEAIETLVKLAAEKAAARERVARTGVPEGARAGGETAGARSSRCPSSSGTTSPRSSERKNCPTSNGPECRQARPIFGTRTAMSPSRCSPTWSKAGDSSSA